jgi:hypothetical protein
MLLQQKIEFQKHILFWLQNEEFFWKWMVNQTIICIKYFQVSKIIISI